MATQGSTGSASPSCAASETPLRLGLPDVAAQGAVLPEHPASNPGHFLPGRIEAGRVLGAAVALPAAVGSVAEGVRSVEIRVEPRHVDETGIVRADRSGGVDDLVRRVGRRGLPRGRLAPGEQDLGANVLAALRVPRGFGEPLAAAGVLDQVVAEKGDEKKDQKRGRTRSRQLTIRFGSIPEQPSCFAAVEQRPV